MAAVHTGQALVNVLKIQGICWSVAKNLAISVPHQPKQPLQPRKQPRLQVQYFLLGRI